MKLKKNLCALVLGVTCLSSAYVAFAADGVSVTGDARKDTYVNGIIYQYSAEVQGLQKQAYELAKIRLDQALERQKKGEYKKPLAIVSDIDETIMDDTTYQAEQMMKDGKWDNGPWDGYYHAVASEADKALPGAVDFFKYAQKKGVEVFYITNRDWDTEDLTIAQLAHAGLPYADKAHVQVMDKTGSSNKDARRANVLKNFDVVMYLGDNIGDFTSAFIREQGALKRTEMAMAPEYKDKWGVEWIVLPNSTYGDWLGAVWFNKKSATDEEKSQYTRDILNHWKYSNTNWPTWYKGYVKD